MGGASEVFKDHGDQVLKSRQAVTGLGQSLTEILKEEGWTKDQVTEQMGTLTQKLIALAVGTDALLYTLTIAVTLDNYAKFIIKEALLPEKS
jgi:hypothetical protein